LFNSKLYGQKLGVNTPLKHLCSNFKMAAMALEEFLLCIMDSRTILKNFKKVAHQLIFLPTMYPNFEFSCLQHKTVVIYMITNTLKK